MPELQAQRELFLQQKAKIEILQEVNIFHKKRELLNPSNSLFRLI